MRMLNTEWLRNPPSPLERTLRRPILHQKIIRLFLVRFLPLWFFCTWALKWIFGFGPGGTSSAGFSAALVIEMFWLQWWYKRFWLPVQLLRVEQIKRLATRRKEITTRELIERVEQSVNLSTRGLVEIGYVGLPSWGWEMLFRSAYPLLVKSPRPPYHELLIGFQNKTVEGDQMLWKISHRRHSGTSLRAIESPASSIRNRSYRPALSGVPKESAGLQDDIDQYIEAFGSKVDDVDLALPTLAEKPDVIASMIALYRGSPSPISLLQNAESRREKATKDALKHVRIPQAVFKKFLVLVQQNVRLREDRRHYEFLGDYPIRLMIKELANRLGKSESEFFQMSWHDIKNAAAYH